MYRVVVLALTFLMALAAHAEAQNRCSGADGVRLLSPGATVQRPMGFAATSTMALRKSDGTAAPMPPTLPPAMNMWDATTLQAVVKSIGADTGELLWTDADKACTQVIVVRDLPVVAEAVCAGGSAILRAGLAVTTPTGFTSAATAPYSQERSFTTDDWDDAAAVQRSVGPRNAHVDANRHWRQRRPACLVRDGAHHVRAGGDAAGPGANRNRCEPSHHYHESE